MSTFKRICKSMQVEEAIQELQNASEIVRLREAVKPHEITRIAQAFELLSGAGSEHQFASRTAVKHENYRKFLKRVQETCGDQMVVLCAIGLGLSNTSAMKDANRVRLPARIQERKTELESDALKRITGDHSARALMGHKPEEARPPGQLSGQVFRLTRQDALAAVTSENVRGQVWMTQPYHTGSLAFINFSISEDLSHDLAIRCPQAM